MKILGFSHGSHDSSYCIYEDGKLIVHEELERLNRVKETDGDILEYIINRGVLFDDFDIITTYPHAESKYYSPTFLKIFPQIKDKFVEVGHHTSHAANAFFSSGFDTALIFTIDGGGWDRLESGMFPGCFTVWEGKNGKINPIEYLVEPNLGWVWSQATTVVFKMSGGGPPYGSQAGTVMGMAAYGNAENFKHIDENFLFKCDFSSLSNLNEQEKFDFAARLQELTEKIVFNLMKPHIEKYNIENICLAGGVALNCVMTGKIKKWFSKIKNIYIPPVPYDAGLSIGCVQYIYHNLYENEIDKNNLQNSPYLGVKYNYNTIIDTIKKYSNEIEYKKIEIEKLCALLADKKIISIFNDKSESGRRALGNRSILADPRTIDIKEIINEKTKHRQWFRPFAPSILEERVEEWFEEKIYSPYMSFAIKFKENKKELVPAVVHRDGTGRLQTVSKSMNPQYYNLLKEWEKLTNIPILLNTSFNDKEPIVETPEDAIKCFLKTKIDFLYFIEHNILLIKK